MYLCTMISRRIIMFNFKKNNMIIPEKEKINVIFSSLFISHYPELYKQLSNIMWNYHKGYGAVCHTKDYWVRDFMPVQVD